MSKNHGKFVWYDLMTTDMEAAAKFYSAVIGWEIKDAGIPDRKYSIVSIGQTMVGGIMPTPKEASGEKQPRWSGYIGVNNVEEATAAIRAAGGTVHKPGEDIPGIGRFAVVADPHGAIFLIFTSLGDETKEDGLGKPGQVGWHELQAGDGQADFNFYSKLFGWTKADAMDMGKMGIYQMFKTGGDQVMGGIMTRCEQMPQKGWLYYFSIKGIDAAVERIKRAGGRVLHGPQQVPGDAWILQCLDPQGGMFALAGSK